MCVYFIRKTSNLSIGVVRFFVPKQFLHHFVPKVQLHGPLIYERTSPAQPKAFWMAIPVSTSVITYRLVITFY